MAVAKPYKFIGFGVMAVAKPYKLIGFGIMAVAKPYESIGFGSGGGGGGGASVRSMLCSGGPSVFRPSNLWPLYICTAPARQLPFRGSKGTPLLGPKATNDCR